MTMTELERIDLEIEKQTEVVRLAEISVYHKDQHGMGEWIYHKDQHGMGEWNELARLKSERDLILTGVAWEPFTAGTVLINNKFVFTLRSYKWRVQGKKTWYRSKGVKHFVDTYVN
jgi:hypothetical protein